MKTTRLHDKILIFMMIAGIALSLFFFIKGDGAKHQDHHIKGKNEKMEHTKYSGVDIITNTDDEETYRSAIHYPKFQGERLNREIGQYVKSTEQKFHEELGKGDQTFLKKRPAVFYLTFDIYPVMDHIYSIVFHEESYYGGANGNQRVKVFIVDVENDQFINQTEMIQNTEQAKEKLYHLLLNAFKQSKQYGPFLFEEELENKMKQDGAYANMYLTNQSFVFIFDKYEVTAGAAGTPEISLSYDQVKNILTEKWADRLSIIPDKPEDLTVPNGDRGNESPSNPPAEKPSSPPSKRVALTFDDGPHPQNTLKILNLLKKYEAKATFFMLGSRVDFYPDIAKKIAEEGNELGNHTWDHKDLTTLNSAEIRKEIRDTNEMIKKTTGREPTVFRPPYGAINDQVKRMVGMPVVLWTVDTLDWQSHDPHAMLQIVKKNVKDGSIILMHDIHESTAEAVEPVLKYLKDEGYTFVTVSELEQH
ncbi:hypothetical protein B6A27_14870 [Anoxybacillus sp. UARK-01]|uniref:polysaccharide deacetylase family protein n=1 Tax=Anoxybacillus sp. UARK-01 TaxID=1895648 RepID=UPI0009BBF07E|nr:polysaccharide deacetylase family protein [Anoxybacillus sp. UARK-01]OQM44742.1 hypothetical protein B6A27_14870 [Anoxybacillus sp. UARK-01]